MEREEEDFGNFLRKLREQIKISATQLAKKIGIHKSNVSRFEEGEIHPRRSTVVRIADALNLFGRERRMLFELCGFCPDEKSFGFALPDSIKEHSFDLEYCRELYKIYDDILEKGYYYLALPKLRELSDYLKLYQHLFDVKRLLVEVDLDIADCLVSSGGLIEAESILKKLQQLPSYQKKSVIWSWNTELEIERSLAEINYFADDYRLSIERLRSKEVVSKTSGSVYKALLEMDEVASRILLKPNDIQIDRITDNFFPVLLETEWKIEALIVVVEIYLERKQLNKAYDIFKMLEAMYPSPKSAIDNIPIMIAGAELHLLENDFDSCKRYIQLAKDWASELGSSLWNSEITDLEKKLPWK